MNREYKRYGNEWRKEASKLPKEKILDIVQELAKFKEVVPICSLEKCESFVEGCLNDFSYGVIDKNEFMDKMFEYTNFIMDSFFENAKKKLKENPEFFK